MKVRYLPLAESEIDEAFCWYEDQRTGLGYEFLTELNETIDRVIVYPEAYTSVDENLRRALVKRFPYGVFLGLMKRVSGLWLLRSVICIVNPSTG